MKKANRGRMATILGVLTSLVTALALVDFDSLDYTSINTWIKILILALPAIGGTVSEVKDAKVTIP